MKLDPVFWSLMLEGFGSNLYYVKGNGKTLVILVYVEAEEDQCHLFKYHQYMLRPEFKNDQLCFRIMTSFVHIVYEQRW